MLLLVIYHVLCSVAQSCPILGDPMDGSLPGSSVHGVLQARRLERVALSFSNIDHVVSLNYLFNSRNYLDVALVMEKAMAPQSSTPAWKIPWTEEPGGLQSMGLLRVGHNWATWLSLFTFMHWRRKWQPTPVFLLESPRDGGAWWASVYGVAQSRTRLKWFRSSSSPC